MPRTLRVRRLFSINVGWSLSSSGDSCLVPRNVVVRAGNAYDSVSLPHMKGHSMRTARIGLVLLLLSTVTAGAVDFLTEGVDNGRTGWVRDEKIFNTANVGSTKLLWKLKLESTPRAMHNLFAPLVAERVTTAQGSLEIGVVAGVSDDLFGIDVAAGRQI